MHCLRWSNGFLAYQTLKFLSFVFCTRFIYMIIFGNMAFYNGKFSISGDFAVDPYQRLFQNILCVFHVVACPCWSDYFATTSWQSVKSFIIRKAFCYVWQHIRYVTRFSLNTADLFCYEYQLFPNCISAILVLELQKINVRCFLDFCNNESSVTEYVMVFRA